MNVGDHVTICNLAGTGSRLNGLEADILGPRTLRHMRHPLLKEDGYFYVHRCYIHTGVQQNKESGFIAYLIEDFIEIQRAGRKVISWGESTWHPKPEFLHRAMIDLQIKHFNTKKR